MKKNNIFKVYAFLIALGIISIFSEKKSDNIEMLSIEEEMDKNDYYNNIRSVFSKEEEYYAFFSSYYDRCGIAFNEDQVKCFKRFIVSLNGEHYEEYNWIKKIIEANPKADLQEGFYHYYVSMIYSNASLTPGIQLSSRIEENIGLLFLMCDEEELNKAIYAGSIEDIKKVIINSTGATKDDIDQLFLQLSVVYSIDNDNIFSYSTSDYEDKFVDEYIDSIDVIMKRIFDSKVKMDEKFANSFLAYSLDDDIHNFYYSYLNDKLAVYLNESTCYLNKEEGLLEYNLDELYHKGAVNVLKINYQAETGEYNLHTLELLSFIVADSTINDMTESYLYEDKLNLLYAELESYFSDMTEFNKFICDLYSHRSVAVKKYMSIFKDYYMHDLSYEKSIKYRRFFKFYSENLFLHADYGVDYNELLSCPREDVEEKFGAYYHWIEDCLFWENDISSDIEELQNFYYQENDYAVLDQNYIELTWNVKEQIFTTKTDVYAISEEVLPSLGKYKNIDVVYYEFPEHYSDTECIRIKENLIYEILEIPVPGIKATLDDGTCAYIVSLNNNINDFESVRFKCLIEELELKKKDVVGLSYEK